MQHRFSDGSPTLKKHICHVLTKFDLFLWLHFQKLIFEGRYAKASIHTFFAVIANYMLTFASTLATKVYHNQPIKEPTGIEICQLGLPEVIHMQGQKINECKYTTSIYNYLNADNGNSPIQHMTS